MTVSREGLYYKHSAYIQKNKYNRSTEEEHSYLRAAVLPAHCSASSFGANTGLALFPSDCPELVRTDRSHIREELQLKASIAVPA